MFSIIEAWKTSDNSGLLKIYIKMINFWIKTNKGFFFFNLTLWEIILKIDDALFWIGRNFASCRFGDYFEDVKALSR